MWVCVFVIIFCVFSFTAIFPVCFYIEFDAGVWHESPPYAAGVEESVFLVEGTLTVLIGGKTVSADRGADISHACHNDSEKECTGYNVIFYSDK